MRCTRDEVKVGMKRALDLSRLVCFGGLSFAAAKTGWARSEDGTSPPKQTFDVCVIGGGVCGLSAALRLAALGQRVAVFERETIGAFSQASAVNSGILESFSTLPVNLTCDAFLDLVLSSSFCETKSAMEEQLLEDALCAGTLGMYSDLSARHSHSLEFQQKSLLVVLQTDDEVEHAKHHLKPTALILNPLELQSIEPSLNTSLKGAVLYPRCGTIHPAKAMRAMKKDALSAGVVIFEMTEVQNINVSQNNARRQWIVEGKSRPHRLAAQVEESGTTLVQCDNLVLACGGMTPAVAQLIDENLVLPVIPVVGQMFEAEQGEMAANFNHLICGYDSHLWWQQNPVTTPPSVTHEVGPDGHWAPRLCRHLYGKQTREGRFIFGGDRRVHPHQSVGYAHPLPRLVDDMHTSCFSYAQSVVKQDTLGRITRKWGGIMPFSQDGMPIIGRVKKPCRHDALVSDKGKSMPPLWCVTGLGGSGFMRGAMAGTLLAEMIGGVTSHRRKQAEILLSSASPSRFTVPSK